MRFQKIATIPFAFPRILFFNFLFILSLHGETAGIWTDNLNIEGVGDFTSAHLRLAEAEALITERLITLEEFESPIPKTINLYNLDGTLHSSPAIAIKFNDAGVLLDETSGEITIGGDTKPLKNYTGPLSNAFTSTNIVLASLTASFNTPEGPRY